MVEELARAAGERNSLAAGLEGGGDGGVDAGVGEEPEHQHPDGAADAVHAEDVQRIVVAEPRLEPRDGQVTDHPASQADEQRRRAR